MLFTRGNGRMSGITKSRLVNTVDEITNHTLNSLTFFIRTTLYLLRFFSPKLESPCTTITAVANNERRLGFFL